MRGMLRWGFILTGASFVLMPIAPHVYPVYDYWQYSPSFFLLRLGLVLVICTGLFRFEKARGVSARCAVTLIGRESLIVYVTHLMLIYGKLGPKTFQEVVGNTFGYPEALLATTILLVLMYLLALGWARIKQGPPRITRGVQLGALATFLYLFFWPQN